MIRLLSESSRNQSTGPSMSRTCDKQAITPEAEQRNVVVVANQRDARRSIEERTYVLVNEVKRRRYANRTCQTIA